MVCHCLRCRHVFRDARIFCTFDHDRFKRNYYVHIHAHHLCAYHRLDSETLVETKYGDYEYATINSVVNKNFDSRFEVICLKILGTEFSAWAT